ncbi:MAG: OmpA family protein [Spirochaetales bacterium]|nr:MAG: OmpA family protein [Spirochaetales bacterium]
MNRVPIQDDTRGCMQNYTRILISIAFMVIAATHVAAQQRLEFAYESGEQYRILSTVDQDVWVNGGYSHHATILNRISINVGDVVDGRGYHDALFVTSEEATGSHEVFTWGEEYVSEFWRDRLGVYGIGDEYFMPVVRDVPVFPDRPLSPGDSWAYPAQEVHDFRLSFGIPDAYHFPIPVTYTYTGNVEQDGRVFALIDIDYNVFYRPNQTYPNALYPVRITGFSDQLLYWDIAAGRPHAYEESYAFVITLSSGDEVMYEGTAEARIIEASRMDRAEVVNDIRAELDQRGFQDQDVVQDDRGVTIRLDNIQFAPDSAFLREGEKRTLEQIADILAKYPDRDILVTGHTALAGTEEGRQRLSVDRATSVGNYLLELGVRERDQITLRGVGATEPLASNATESGMRKNRRVEITILEN